MHTTIIRTHIRCTLLVALLLTAALLLKADRRMASATAAPARQPLPALQGQPAVDYLKEHGLFEQLKAAVESSRYEIQRPTHSSLRSVWQAENPAHNLRADFAPGGVRLTPSQAGQRPAWHAALRLRGVGYGTRINTVTAGPARANGTRVEYVHALNPQSAIANPQLTEWYVNTPAGIEQGFTLRERPGLSFGNEPLRVALAVTGEVTARLENAGQTVVLARRNGLPVLRYDHLVAWDALGRALPARMEVRGAEIALVVEDAAAVYPLTIDPLFSEVKKFTASDAAPNDYFGQAVGISGDTVVVGAHRKNSSTGTAYVFGRNQGGADNWGEVKKLTASAGAMFDQFGFAVGISADTIVIGANSKNSGTGAAYVFGRNQGGADSWGEVKILVASDAAAGDNFGYSVGISGETVVVGAFAKNSGTGAAYIYTRNQGGADQWGEVKILAASDAAVFDNFGYSVRISGDAVVVGAYNKGSRTGAAYIYTRNQGGADQWGEVKKLTASDGAAGDNFGWSVGVSGETIVVGAFDKNSSTGAAYVFARNQGGADNWGEVKKLTASDGVMFDNFGYSVGISGETVVVGAFAKNSARGVAYLFARNQGGASNWGEVEKLTASDAAAGDFFGYAVALSGETVVSGAFNKSSSRGAAYAFTNQCGTWTQTKKANASDGTQADNLGAAVAVSGDTVVVGAPSQNSDTGAAYVFARNQAGADNWGQVKKLTASDAAVGDSFGNAVVLNGDTVVVGARGKNTLTGAAYIFKRNQGGADNWGEVKKLTASNPAAFDNFGSAVGISGGTVVVGAFFKSAAYLFERNQGGADNWGQVKILTASDAEAFDDFGVAVALDGDTVVVGANRHNSDTGAAYIFGRNQGGADNWGEVKILTASDAAADDRFGNAVTISADTVVVGADRKNNFIGAAYVFARNQGGADNWGQVKKLTVGDPGPDDRFGFSVSLSTDMVVVGAPSQNSATGAAYVFARNQGGADNWGQAQKLTASDAAVGDQFGGSVAISGETIVAGASAKNAGFGAVYIFNFDCPSFSPPTISKDFSPTTIQTGGMATVTLTLTNPNAAPLTNAAFTDLLMNMHASGGAVGGTCSGTTPGTLNADATALSFSGITIPANGSCTVTFGVTSTTPGVQPNQTSGVTTTQTPTAGAPSNTANLTVTCATITVNPASVPAGRLNQPYPATTFSVFPELRPAGSSVPFTFMLTGKLPTGLNFSNATLTGTPTQAGSFNFTVTATESASGCTGSRSYTLIIKRSNVKADFDGDGKTDLSVWRGNEGNWYALKSSTSTPQVTLWGSALAPFNDVIVPGDYDGDGKTDQAVFRRQTGTWYVIKSSDNQFIVQAWGLGTDTPVPGDYDGDGQTDFAVWRGRDTNWYIRRSSDSQAQVTSWGAAALNDVPVAADYDGDGQTDLAVWRPSEGKWYVQRSSDGASEIMAWGTAGDQPVPADYDGDGKVDLAVWRPSDGNWYVLKSSDGMFQVTAWGSEALNDVLVPGDYDGDGKADLAVWRPDDSVWYVRRSSDSRNLTQAFGQNGDTPVPANGVR